jgi:sugar phosphate isomerase/epimerase
MNRRTALSLLGSAGVATMAESVSAQSPPTRVTPEVAAERLKPGTRPLLCLYSACLAKIPYAQLPEIVRSMGYDGVDLTVMNGGHVDPSKYMVDLDRAFQTFQDAGLELPMVTTNFTSPSQPYSYAILYVSGQLGARFCRLGTWPAPVPATSGQIAQMRTAIVRNDLVQFSVTALRCNITALLTNHAGSYPGGSIPEVEAVLAGVAPAACGYCFDPAQAVLEARSPAGWEPALQAALPRLSAVALSDVVLDPAPHPCALGAGVIDWQKFFNALATARFHGPISMYRDYETGNEVGAMGKDLAFARARVDEAWRA